VNEQASRASVYEWLRELNAAGGLELVEAARGSRPTIWSTADLPDDQDVLPEVEALFE
jgi:hypothetical protein